MSNEKNENILRYEEHDPYLGHYYQYTVEGDTLKSMTEHLDDDLPPTSAVDHPAAISHLEELLKLKREDLERLELFVAAAKKTTTYKIELNNFSEEYS